jgi:hypothetical protein
MSAGMPELGSKISLISKADIRYEGRLFTVDPQECTIALANGESQFAFLTFVRAAKLLHHCHPVCVIPKEKGFIVFFLLSIASRTLLGSNT